MTIDLTGIGNENEFFSHHYLVAILEQDLRDVLGKWRQQADEGRDDPLSGLRNLRKPFNQLRFDLGQETGPKSGFSSFGLSTRVWRKCLGISINPGSGKMTSTSPSPSSGKS
ncbi:MAG: hypothetical protein WA705_22840 [Candidatus Ozemobacteraceae bacterium]